MASRCVDAALDCRLPELLNKLGFVLFILESKEDQEDGSPNLTESTWDNKMADHLRWRSDEEDEDSDFGEEQRDRYLKVQK